MDQAALEARLVDLPLGPVYYFDSLPSTNDEAARLAERGAGDLTLVVAGEQTAGRGRAGRRWYTPAGAGLAFSLTLLPGAGEGPVLPQVTALGALAACDALRTLYRLQASIKWPNDVLVEGHKVAGVLVEARWIGEGRSVEGAGDDRPSTLVLGIGINLAPASVSEARRYERATSLQVACLEEFLRGPVDPLELLHAVLAELVVWRGRLGTPAFVGAWESRLAYRGEWVQVFQGDVATQEGLVVGLAPDGSLKLRSRSGEVVAIRAGEARLRLA